MSGWFRRGTNSGATFTIFCFPFAGVGPSVFLSWRRYLGQSVRLCVLQLPGRETRSEEACITEWDRACDEITEAMAPLVQGPYGVFGHSLGGLLAHGVLRRLQARGAQAPEWLCASACLPPSLSGGDPLHMLSDQDLLAHLDSLSSSGISLLRRSSSAHHILPVLRRDLELADSYRYPGPFPLTCPIVALAGSEDKAVPAQEMMAWKKETSSFLNTHSVAGGHLFMLESPLEVTSILTTYVAHARRGPQPLVLDLDAPVEDYQMVGG